MAVAGKVNPKAEAMNRARDDLRQFMKEGGIPDGEIEKNVSVLEQFIYACINWKLN